MPAKDDTAKLVALRQELMGDIDDTDSLPTLPGASRKSPGASRRMPPDAGVELRQPRSADVDGLDWLVNLTKTVDKRIDRIEEELRQIKLLLAEERKGNGGYRSALRSFLAGIRRRFR